MVAANGDREPQTRRWRTHEYCNGKIWNTHVVCAKKLCLYRHKSKHGHGDEHVVKVCEDVFLDRGDRREEVPEEVVAEV